MLKHLKFVKYKSDKTRKFVIKVLDNYIDLNETTLFKVFKYDKDTEIVLKINIEMEKGDSEQSEVRKNSTLF